MWKSLVKLAAVIVVVYALWVFALDMQSKFLIRGYVRSGLGMAKLVGTQDNLTVRFDYDIAGTSEAGRAKKLVEYFKSVIPDKELWYALIVDKLGNTYRVYFPVKQGIENDFLMMLQMKALVNEISTQVFDGGRVDLHLCDTDFKTVRVVPAN